MLGILQISITCEKLTLSVEISDIIKGYLISQGLSHSNGLLAKSYNDKFDIDFKTIYKNLMNLLL